MGAEEAQPLMQGQPSAAATGNGTTITVGKDRDGATLKGVVITTLAALVLYLLAATASRTILWEEMNFSAESSSEDGSDSLDLSVQATASSLQGGLINPVIDSGKPTLTTTEDCTGDKSLPVLGGVDVVSYWTLTEGATPVHGTPTLMALFRDYRFFFSSIENLREFESDPEKYIPAWGAFCSYGISDESMWTADNLGPFADPSQWMIEGGRLHVFRSNLPKLKWSEAIAENLKAGDATWGSWFPAEEGPGPLNTACLCSEEMCDDA